MVIRAKHLSSILGLSGLLCLTAHAFAEEAVSPYAIQTSSTPIPMSDEDPDLNRIGKLIYRGGVEIASTDENFGGLSGLLVSPDISQFIAVTDKGAWVRGKLVYDDGKLKAVKDLELAPMRDDHGDSILGSKKKGDAESLTGIWPEGAANPTKLFVSFEHKHRIDEYDFGTKGFDARPKTRPIPKGVQKAAVNSGLESVEWDGSENENLLAFVEEPFKGQNTIAGWIIGETGAIPLELAERAPYKMTDLGRLPNGDYLTLERRFSPIGGVGAEIRHLPIEAFMVGGPLDGEVLAEIAPPETVDNMEGMSVRVDGKGRTLIFLVSDDNFNVLQRTILLMYELPSQ